MNIPKPLKGILRFLWKTGIFLVTLSLFVFVLWLVLTPKKVEVQTDFGSYRARFEKWDRIGQIPEPYRIRLFDTSVPKKDTDVYRLKGLEDTDYVWCYQLAGTGVYETRSYSHLASLEKDAEEPVVTIDAVGLRLCSPTGEDVTPPSLSGENGAMVAREIQKCFGNWKLFRFYPSSDGKIENAATKYIHIRLVPECDLYWQTRLEFWEDGRIVMPLPYSYPANDPNLQADPDTKPHFCDVTEVLGPYWDEIVYGTES